MPGALGKKFSNLNMLNKYELTKKNIGKHNKPQREFQRGINYYEVNIKTRK